MVECSATGAARLLPDRIVQNLERARLSRDGRCPMLKAGLGYEECLSSVIVDGTAVDDSSTENILFPDLMIPANYLQPGGIPEERFTGRHADESRRFRRLRRSSSTSAMRRLRPRP